MAYQASIQDPNIVALSINAVTYSLNAFLNMGNLFFFSLFPIAKTSREPLAPSLCTVLPRVPKPGLVPAFCSAGPSEVRGLPGILGESGQETSLALANFWGVFLLCSFGLLGLLCPVFFCVLLAASGAGSAFGELGPKTRPCGLDVLLSRLQSGLDFSTIVPR